MNQPITDADRALAEEALHGCRLSSTNEPYWRWRDEIALRIARARAEGRTEGEAERDELRAASYRAGIEAAARICEEREGECGATASEFDAYPNTKQMWKEVEVGVGWCARSIRALAAKATP